MHSTMNRREVFKAAGALALARCLRPAISPAQPLQKPNVVICLCDQLRSFEVGCYGNGVIRTPNIDRLATAGCRFDQSVVNNPVCVPSRSTLLSGQYSRTCTGSVWNDALEGVRTERTRFPQQTLAEALHRAGYHTGIIGKWHLAVDPFVLGFEYAMYPVYTECERNYGSLYRENSNPPQKFSTGGGRELLPDGFNPDFVVSKMRDFIARNKSGPFFLDYNILQPHMPIGPGSMPEKYTKMYNRDEVPLRKNVFQNGVMARDEHWFKVYTVWEYACRNRPGIVDRKHDRLPEGFDLRDLTADYYGAVACADDQVGELMKALETNGIAENTIVVLSADHGDMLGSHQAFNKSRLFEEAIRVPIIFRYPQGIRPSENTKQVACTTDIMPTLLALCGLPIPEGIQGQSLVPILRREQESLEKDFAFIETDGYDIGIRTPTHLYGMAIQREQPQVITNDQLYFFDLRRDPLEMKNLAGTDEQRELAASLRRRLAAWNQSTPWLQL